MKNTISDGSNTVVLQVEEWCDLICFNCTAVWAHLWISTFSDLALKLQGGAVDPDAHNGVAWQQE